MFKTIQIIVMAALCLNFNSRAQSQKTLPLPEKQAILGKVVSATTGEALPGAVIKTAKPNHTTISNDKGEFILTLSNGAYNITTTHVGYKSKTVSIQIPLKKQLVISLDTDDKSLQEVEIVSTGYQNIPKERATGSFVLIDSALLNRRVGTNIIDRLEGVTNSLFIDKRSGSNTVNIRGMNTLNDASLGALIVVDNFPYSGNINNINPNDVESVTILKDAAATSIWGARAGNGVIVITLKKGKFNRPFTISANVNLTINEKPNLFYFPKMNSSEFIDVEQMLFEKRFYSNDLSASNKAHAPISPVVNILDQQNRGLILQTEAIAQINALRSLDYRHDLSKYFYRNSINQQYSFNSSGGGAKLNYILTGGYDNNIGSKLGNENKRYTLRSVNSFKPIKGMEITAAIGYTESSTQSNGNEANYPTSGGRGNLYPYAQIVDTEGNSLSLVKKYNTNYTDTAGKGRLLDWSYKPLDELRNADNQSKVQVLNIGINLKYTIIEGLNAEVLYKYEKIISNSSNYNSIKTYNTRDLINRFTKIQGNAIIRPVPLGGILDMTYGDADNQNIRSQINFNKTLNNKHDFTALIGGEASQVHSFSNASRTYGYNNDILSYANVDFVNPYPIYDGLSGNSYIPNSVAFKDNLRRVISLYGNAAYSFANRYTISASARKDGSNLFGENTNAKWKPLWSAGTSWTVSNEKFYQVSWLPYLRLRSTYGYSGIMAGGATNRPVLLYLSAPDPNTNLKQAQITYPPNPDLKWEETRMINYGLDFSIRNQRVSGSLEYYTKLCKDLFSTAPIDATTGFSEIKANVGEIKSTGLDLLLNANNLIGKLKWKTTFSASYVKDIVSKFYGNVSNASFYVSNNALAILPVKGYPLYSISSYFFSGLDGQTGDPLGYYRGEVSKAYSNIVADSIKNLKYNGSAIPLYTGFLTNTFSWKQLSLSFNITYKFRYYFHRETINYTSLFNSWKGNADFSQRWQVPGDERITQIPSMAYPANSSRDAFFAGSEATVEKGDHIRLQDIRLSYNWINNHKKIPIKKVQFYAYINNIGFLWAANKTGQDPDYTGSSFPAQRSIALGLKTDF